MSHKLWAVAGSSSCSSSTENMDGKQRVEFKLFLFYFFPISIIIIFWSHDKTTKLILWWLAQFQLFFSCTLSSFRSLLWEFLSFLNTQTAFTFPFRMTTLLLPAHQHELQDVLKELQLYFYYFTFITFWLCIDCQWLMFLSQ